MLLLTILSLPNRHRPNMVEEFVENKIVNFFMGCTSNCFLLFQTKLLCFFGSFKNLKFTCFSDDKHSRSYGTLRIVLNSIALPQPLNLGSRTSFNNACQGNIPRSRGFVIRIFRFRFFDRRSIIGGSAYYDWRTGKVLKF